MDKARHVPDAAPVPLFWRISLFNSVVLIVATALLLGPVTVSTPVLLTEAAILTGGLVVILVANVVLLRIGLGPLRQLARAMTTTDLLRPRPRVRPKADADGEIAELITTFNTMLDRLEAERVLSAARTLSAQESERHRVAQELYDEVGQTLAAVLLDLKRVADQAPDEVREQLSQVQETTRASLDEIRRIARRLLPGVLEQLGLCSALRSLSDEFTGPSLTVRHEIASGLPDLGDNADLVLYRVAQESLTNAARHSGARLVVLSLERAGDAVQLRVRDDGRGFDASAEAAEGAGIRGMRERALLIGADLVLGPAHGGGTEVRLTVPVGVGGPDRIA